MTKPAAGRPDREIRAFYTGETIRVYQAYSHEIADSALAHQRFVSPPFSMTRMTWIKPSFCWMMYRSGWAKKDPGQQRILAIDMTHDGFKWAIEHGCPSHAEPGMSESEWRAAMARSPVRIQWDPERDVTLAPLPWRTIQIGLGGEAVRRFTEDWIVQIGDKTAAAHEIHKAVLANNLGEAGVRLPREFPYEVGMSRKRYLELKGERLLELDHQEHEWIVSILQEHADNDSVPYLEKTIEMKPQLGYLSHDDYGSYYKKCLWALQDIGTPDALALIRKCARSAEPALRKQALYRLTRIAG